MSVAHGQVIALLGVSATSLCACGMVRETSGRDRPDSGAIHLLPSDDAGARAGSSSGGGGADAAPKGVGGSAGTTSPDADARAGDASLGFAQDASLGFVGQLHDSGTLPAVLAEHATVWIGEVASFVTYPEASERLIQSITGPQKVVLILDPITTGAVTGTVTFGDGTAPRPPQTKDEAYPSVVAAFSDNLTGSPFVGFVYSLVGSGAYGARLSLAYVPLELWRVWCARWGTVDDWQKCDCSVSPCTSLEAPMRGIDLVVDGDTMVGEYAVPWRDGNPAIELRRVR